MYEILFYRDQNDIEPVKDCYRWLKMKAKIVELN